MARLAGCMALSHGPQLMMPPNQWHVLAAKDRREHGAALAAAPAPGDERDEVKWSKWRRLHGSHRRAPDQASGVGHRTR